MSAPLIQHLHVQNLLSYGPAGLSLDLHPLNVLIGPNASGKSNLLEVLAILRSTADDVQSVVREGGGIGEYLWKENEGNSWKAVLQVHVVNSSLWFESVITHVLELLNAGSRLLVHNEVIANHMVTANGEVKSDLVYTNSGVPQPTLYALSPTGVRQAVEVTDLRWDESILAQRRDPNSYPEITFLGDEFANITLFQEWNFGRRTSARLPQPTDLPSDFLLPDASNLGLVLHDIGQTSAGRDELIAYLRRFYENARYISTKIQGGTIQLFIEEEGGRMIPATRLSDGTLRYLCLLAILCHPNPPPVIGIEEPELGLHPDIIPTIAELLRKASERTQLFVTTHSDTLVSALSDIPESILVCESTPDGTTMRRLEADKLKDWLANYSLGEIWRMGEIGGNRW